MDLSGRSNVIQADHMKERSAARWGNRIGLAGVLCAGILAWQIACAQLDSEAPRESSGAQSRITFSQSLPELDGTHLKVKAVEVTYPPGASSSPHSHPCPVIGYVVGGAVRMQVQGEPEAIYKAGDTFYEAPNGVHLISANASDREPAKFIAYFVCDHDTPLSTAVPELKTK